MRERIFNNVLLETQRGLPLWLRLSWSAACAFAAAFAVAVVWIVGHRGIYPYDESTVFDGGWRIVQGQVMYRDFFAPYGPVVYSLQALFFRLTGVTFSSMVLAGGVVNAIAAMCVIWIVRRVAPAPAHRFTALAGGFLTALWFGAPSGILWYEQTACCFNLIAVALLLETGFTSERAAPYLRIAAGCSLALSVLSKQSAGVVLSPVPLAIVLLTSGANWRQMVVAFSQVLAGILLVCVLFIAWLLLASSFEGFWQSVVVMSSSLGTRRIALVHNASDLLLLRLTWPFVRVAVATLALCTLAPRVLLRGQNALILSLLIGYLILQNVFAAITFNQVANSVGYVGLLNALAFILLTQIFSTSTPYMLVKWLKRAVLILAALALFGRSGMNAWRIDAERTVQEFDSNTTFTKPLHVKGASRVWWGEPTFLNSTSRATRQDFDDLNAWLDKSQSNFFVFSNSSLLYGLHHRVSPQPWVFLGPDHSFLSSDSDRVSSVIVDSLKKNHVTVIVLEGPLFENDSVLVGLPSLHTWIQQEFRKEQQFGGYQVWTMRTAAPVTTQRTA
jgi:4-amino-4-deoxy-L-arabinose transferase-like glycosyltransferase